MIYATCRPSICRTTTLYRYQCCETAKRLLPSGLTAPRRRYTKGALPAGAGKAPFHVKSYS